MLFPHAVDGPERQGRTWDTLDRKALGVLTTASVSIGLTVFAIAGSAPVGALVFFGLALASCLLVAVATIWRTVWLGKWYSARPPDVLGEPSDATARSLANDRSVATVGAGSVHAIGRDLRCSRHGSRRNASERALQAREPVTVLEGRLRR